MGLFGNRKRGIDLPKIPATIELITPKDEVDAGSVLVQGTIRVHSDLQPHIKEVVWEILLQNEQAATGQTTEIQALLELPLVESQYRLELRAILVLPGDQIVQVTPLKKFFHAHLHARR